MPALLHDLCSNAEDLFPSFQSKLTFMKAINEIPRRAEWSLKLVHVEGDELGQTANR